MRHIRSMLTAATLLAVPLLTNAEDREGTNPINPWEKVNKAVIKTTLKKIKEDPKAHLGQRVMFTCRYHKSENKYHPFYTGITANEFDNFSVWSMDSVLFREDSFARDLPFVYVAKDTKAKTHIAKLNKFQVITITGVVKSAYLGQPWIVAERVDTKWFSTKLHDKALSQARMGLSLIEEKQYAAAARELEATLKQDFDDYLEAQVGKYCGYAYLEAGEAKKALPYLESSYAIIKDAQTGGWWGQALVRAGQADNAVGMLEDVVEAYPTHLGLRLAMAEAYGALKKANNCVRHARAALSLKPGHKDAYLFMGDVLVNTGQDSEALKIYREAELKAIGDKGEFSWAMGEIYYRQKQYQKSFNEFENAKRSFPGSDILSLDTARAYREAGVKFHVKAARNFNRAFEINPDHVWPRLELGSMHYDDKEYEPTIVALKDFLDRQKNHIPALIMKGISHEKLGHFKEAAADFALVEQLEGKGYASHHLGFNLLAASEYQGSADAYGRAAWSNIPKLNRFDAAFNAGALYLMLKQNEKALPLAELSHQLNPEYIPAAMNAAIANEHAERTQKAFRILDKFHRHQDANAKQKVIIQKHWLYNALVLGKTPLNEERLVDTANFVKSKRADDPHVQLSYGWLLARSHDERCRAYLKPFRKTRLEARLAMLEFYLGQGRLDEAELETKGTMPKGHALVQAKFNKLLRELKEKIDIRNERLAEEEEKRREEEGK